MNFFDRRSTDVIHAFFDRRSTDVIHAFFDRRTLTQVCKGTRDYTDARMHGYSLDVEMPTESQLYGELHNILDACV